jgi:hypothetical protein
VQEVPHLVRQRAADLLHREQRERDQDAGGEHRADHAGVLVDGQQPVHLAQDRDVLEARVAERDERGVRHDRHHHERTEVPVPAHQVAGAGPALEPAHPAHQQHLDEDQVPGDEAGDPPDRGEGGCGGREEPVRGVAPPRQQRGQQPEPERGEEERAEHAYRSPPAGRPQELVRDRHRRLGGRARLGARAGRRRRRARRRARVGERGVEVPVEVVPVEQRVPLVEPAPPVPAGRRVDVARSRYPPGRLACRRRAMQIHRAGSYQAHRHPDQTARRY